jgi:hypothetical protein
MFWEFFSSDFENFLIFKTRKKAFTLEAKLRFQGAKNSSGGLFPFFHHFFCSV